MSYIAEQIPLPTSEVYSAILSVIKMVPTQDPSGPFPNLQDVFPNSRNLPNLGPITEQQHLHQELSLQEKQRPKQLSLPSRIRESSPFLDSHTKSKEDLLPPKQSITPAIVVPSKLPPPPSIGKKRQSVPVPVPKPKSASNPPQAPGVPRSSLPNINLEQAVSIATRKMFEMFEDSAVETRGVEERADAARPATMMMMKEFENASLIAKVNDHYEEEDIKQALNNKQQESNFFEEFASLLELPSQTGASHMAPSKSLFEQTGDAFFSMSESDLASFTMFGEDSNSSSALDDSVLASTQIPTIDDADDLIASATSTLLSSFETPALVPSSTATQVYSDFSSSPDQPLIGDMFPGQQASNGKESTTAATTATKRDSISSADFGCESAFDDVDASTVQEMGLFNLPLFGGMPAAAATASPKPRAQHRVSFQSEVATTNPSQLSEYANASPRHALVDSPEVAMGSISPHDVHTTPALSSMGDDFEEESVVGDDLSSLSGKAQSQTAARKSLKRRKPYESTGTRATSRPILDADAPTMTRNYAAPGKTTKKAIPVGFQKKLKLSVDEAGQPVDPDAVDETVMNEIEEKRRKNCVAARESRRRKQEHLNGLKDEIHQWRHWATQVDDLLKSAGLAGLLEGISPRPQPAELEL